MSNKCKVVRKKSGVWKVEFNFTTGELLSLINAIRIGRTVSPVAKDVGCYLRNALCDSPDRDNERQELLDQLNEDIGLKVVRGEP